MNIKICTHFPLLSERHTPCNGKYKTILAGEINHEIIHLWELTPNSTVSEENMCKVDITARILLLKFRHYAIFKSFHEYNQSIVEDNLNHIIETTTFLMTTPTVALTMIYNGPYSHCKSNFTINRNLYSHMA
jgi:hypothetical protein